MEAGKILIGGVLILLNRGPLNRHPAKWRCVGGLYGSPEMHDFDEAKIGGWWMNLFWLRK
jgi:hypothetical protein